MKEVIGLAAEEPIRTVVLDGLSWRDIALGALPMLVVVLFLLVLAALPEKRRHGELRPEEGGDLSDPGS